MVDVKITGVFLIRNAFEIPYPFVEALLSIYPIVDEYYVVDGGSTDGTYEVLLKLSKIYPKIKVIRMEENPSPHYEVLDYEINYVMHNLANGEWLWQVQADEGFHERTLKKLKELVLSTKEDGIIQPRFEVYFFRHIQKDGYIYYTNRIVRIKPEIYWIDGADDILLKGERRARKIGIRVDIPFYHFSATWAFSRYRRMLRHLKWIGTKQFDRKKVLASVARSDYTTSKQFDKILKTPPSPEIPEIFKPLAYMKNYYVREELYDPEYLNKIYCKYGLCI